MGKRVKKTETVVPAIEETLRTKDQERKALRNAVRIFYDLQRMRMQIEGRTKHDPEKGDIILHPDDLARLMKRTEELLALEKAALADIEALLAMNAFYTGVLRGNPKYIGIGPTMGGYLLAEIDIHRAANVSKLWRYAGLSVLPAFRCRKCHGLLEELPDGMYRHRMASTKKEEDEEQKMKAVCKRGEIIPVTQTYLSGERERPVAGEKLHYNKHLKTKVLGVLGPIIVKYRQVKCPECNATMKKSTAKTATAESTYVHAPANAKKEPCSHQDRTLSLEECVVKVSPFRNIYDARKRWRQENGWGRNPAHVNADCIRYMMKMFLAQFWEDWRTFEGLEVRPSYQEEKLGHKHTPPVAPVKPRVQNDAPFESEIDAEMDLLDQE